MREGRKLVTGKWQALVVIALAELLAMSLWFSATAAAPELADAWGLSAGQTAWLTMAVQLGFVAGALVSAVLTLSDTIEPRLFFAGSAVLGAGATVAIAAFVDSATPAIALRFLTGMALAGVYPTGMKLMSGWFSDGRGVAIGTLVGALTVGSALPHLLRAVGGVGEPRAVLYGAAALALVGAVLVLFVGQGPHQAPAAPFDPAAVGRMARNSGVVLADFGYFGHMWELYAVWTWIPAFLLAAGVDPEAGALLSFGTIAIGGAGAVVAGVGADRAGRTTVTSASMVLSGAACLTAGLVFDAPLVVLAPFVLLWGFVVVADSAQFSACVTELAEESYVGTALTLQTAVGFLLTVFSIRMVPLLADALGWQWAFAPLAVGPALGTVAMLALRVRPEARQLAGGAR
ncbi:MAG: MFS transporter [Haloarculaceae archaeon]